MTVPAPDTLPAMRCPKCHADMATYERAGILIDQCRECRGIFLDRGELEKLIDAESALSSGLRAAPTAVAQAPAPAWDPGRHGGRGYDGRPPVAVYDRRDWRDDDDDDDDDRRRWGDPDDGDPRGYRGDRRPRRRSFLGDLLEGLGD